MTTAEQHGWEELTNGDLLDAAEEYGIDVFVTTDNKNGTPTEPPETEVCNGVHQGGELDPNQATRRSSSGGRTER